PQGGDELAVQPGEEALAVLLVAVGEQFGGAVRREAVALLLQGEALLRQVVDLAVADHGEGTVLRGGGPGLRGDEAGRHPAPADAGLLVGVALLEIPVVVAHRLGHAGQGFRRHGGTNETEDAGHRAPSSELRARPCRASVPSPPAPGPRPTRRPGP